MFELKECPLCDNEVRFKCSSTGRNGIKYVATYRIECDNCGLYTKAVDVTFGYEPLRGAFAETNKLEELVSNWNTRQ